MASTKDTKKPATGTAAAPSANGGKPGQSNPKSSNPVPNKSSASNGGVDASKPSSSFKPRNVKPDPAKKTADLEAIALELKKLRDERDAVSKKMKDIREKNKGSGEERAKLRQDLTPIKEALQKARAEKDQVLNRFKQASAGLDALYMEERKSKDGLGKFTSVEDIEAEIQRREKAMFEGRFSAREEKDMIRDMDKLRMSKKNVGVLHAKQEEVRKAKEARKEIDLVLAEKKAVVDDYQRRFLVVKDALTALDAKEKSGVAAQLPGLREKHDGINEKLAELDTKRQEVYDNWKKANLDFIRAEETRRVEEQAARAEEQAKYTKEREDAKAAREAELEKIKPWEEEIALCDMLAAYLSRLAGKEVVSLSSASSSPALPEGAGFAKKEPKKSSSSFANLKPLQRHGEDDDMFVAPTKTKKINTNNAKPTKVKSAQPLIHDPSTLESFGKVGCKAPLLLTDVDAALEEVKAARAYFDVLPRNAKPKRGGGAVEASLAEKAKPVEKTEEKMARAPPGLSKPPSVQDATLFPGLPGSKAPVATETSWGPKSSPSSSPAIEDNGE